VSAIGIEHALDVTVECPHDPDPREHGFSSKVNNAGSGNTVGGGSSWLLKRDIDPASNDNDPMWLRAAA
jgi:hypothetical protein